MRGLAPPSVDASRGGDKEAITPKMSVPNSPCNNKMDCSIMPQSDKAIEGNILTICNRVNEWGSRLRTSRGGND